MIIKLNPTIYIDTPLLKGQALFIIDYGVYQNSCWVITLENNGIIKHFDQIYNHFYKFYLSY